MSLVKEILEDIMTINLRIEEQNSDIYEKNTITYYKNLNLAVIIANVHIDYIQEDTLVYIVYNKPNSAPDSVIEKLQYLTEDLLDIKYSDQYYASSNIGKLKGNNLYNFTKVYVIDNELPSSVGWLNTYYDGSKLNAILERTNESNTDGYKTSEAFSIFSKINVTDDQFWLDGAYHNYDHC